VQTKLFFFTDHRHTHGRSFSLPSGGKRLKVPKQHLRDETQEIYGVSQTHCTVVLFFNSTFQRRNNVFFSQQISISDSQILAKQTGVSSLLCFMGERAVNVSHSIGLASSDMKQACHDRSTATCSGPDLKLQPMCSKHF
jgi:hypothetical protein